MARIKGWTKCSSEALSREWRRPFSSEEEALAHAIWVANRLIKDRAKSTRKKFYFLKDEWLRRMKDHLVEGRIAREESSECYACEGTGVEMHRPFRDCYEEWDEDVWDDDDDIDPDEEDSASDCPCSRCDGTGKFRVWYLYEHHLVVAGTRYCFHSYVKPESLTDTPGADLESYGGRFTEEELENLALPVTGLIRVIAFMMGLKWNQESGGWTER